MYKILKAITVVSVVFSFAYMPFGAVAQNYKGDYSGEDTREKKDLAARPVPKVFSSKLSSVKQAEKLDVVYDNLFVSLWIYAGAEAIYQKKLYAHMAFKKFKLTRYAKEFSGDLGNAMESLNENHRNMMSDISNAEQKYIEIKEGIRMADHEVLETLWEEKIGEFRENSETYFKMQHKFLNTYKSLVGFVMKQGGTYYYNSEEKKLYFYKHGGLTYFGKSIDTLRKISFEQRKLLKANAPANLNEKFR